MTATTDRRRAHGPLLDAGTSGRGPARHADVLTIVLALIAAIAIAVPTLVVVKTRGFHREVALAALPRRVVPRDQLPSVEPVKLVDLAPDAARAFNADQPFSSAPIPPARPFQFAGGVDDRARATDCLAAAELYEAGDDATGERAVAQVVLNRLRHPAFPKSVCAVVFEGSERNTGCQFTFACDGALDRWHPGDAAWQRARQVAAAALGGSVDRTVGYATHYHTDWVVPYWQASLDKIAAVGTHLFFRWAGWWGTPAAFTRVPTGGEPVIALLAPVSPAHAAPATLTADGTPAPGGPFFGKTLKPLANDPDTFLTSLDPAQPAESYRAVALQACGDRPHCKVLGWTDVSAMAFTTPLSPEAQAALSFSYLRDKASGFEKALWNCAEFTHAPPGGCMKRTPASRSTSGPDAVPAARLIADDAQPDELSGVRRKSVAAPPAPTATPVKPPRTSPGAAP